MDEDILKLKSEIIEVLNLEGLTPDDIDDDAPLFEDGLDLDSIDILELIVLMKKNYEIDISDPNEGEKIFRSVRSMAEYIKLHKGENPQTS